MSKAITITDQNILSTARLHCKIPEIVEKIITQKVIENAATDASIKVEMEELQKAADQFRSLNKLQTADKTWAWLENNGLSLDDFEELVYISSLADKLVQHLFADRVESYFFEHQLDYAVVVMYEVVLDDEDLALEFFYSIQEGEASFHNVAHQYIQEPELRRKGGYLGRVNRKDLKSEISAAVFAASPPQVLKPILTSKGAHLILVEEIIQPQLDHKLRSQIMSNLFSEWLKQQIAEVEIIKQFNLSN